MTTTPLKQAEAKGRKRKYTGAYGHFLLKVSYVSLHTLTQTHTYAYGMVNARSRHQAKHEVLHGY